MGFFSDVDMNEMNEEVTEKGMTGTVSMEEDSSVLEEATFYEEKTNFENLLPSDTYEVPVEKEPLKKAENNYPEKEDEIPEKITVKKESKPVTETEIESSPSVKTEPGKSAGATAIAMGTTVEGNVSANGGLSIDGTVNGDVSANEGVTVFRHGIVNGNILSKGRVSIRGKVSGDISGNGVSLEKTTITGSITSLGSITIGPGAVVIGNISAENAVITGAVNGDIDVKGHVVLEASAIVKGNIRSKSVQVANGAAVDGVCSQCYADVNPSTFFENLNK